MRAISRSARSTRKEPNTRYPLPLLRPALLDLQDLQTPRALLNDLPAIPQPCPLLQNRLRKNLPDHLTPIRRFQAHQNFQIGEASLAIGR